LSRQAIAAVRVEVTSGTR